MIFCLFMIFATKNYELKMSYQKSPNKTERLQHQKLFKYVLTRHGYLVHKCEDGYSVSRRAPC